MYKIKTSDHSSFITLIAGIGISLSFLSPALANNNNNGGPSVDCAKEAKEVAAVEVRDANGRVNQSSEAYKTAFRNAYSKCRSGGDEVGCKKDLKDLNDAKSKLVASCGAAKLSSSGSAGNIACSDAIKTCERATDERVSSDSDLPYDTDAARSMPSYCPVGSENIKDIRQELKEAKENVDKLQDEIPELQKQITESQSAGQDEILQLQEQAQEAQKQCNQTQKDLQRNLLDREREIYNQAQQLYANMRQVKDQIAQAENEKIKASQNARHSIDQLELGCYKMAIEKINAKRNLVLQKVDKSQYNLGGLHQTVAAAGLTTRKQDQISAQQEFNFCKNGRDYMLQLDRIRKDEDDAIVMVDRRIASLQTELGPIQEQIGKMQTEDIARMRQETQQDMADLKNQCYEQNALITQRMGQAQNKAFTAAMTAKQDLNRKQLRLQEAEAEYKNIRDFHRIKNSGGGGDAEKFYEANAALANYEGKARSFKLSCCGDVEGMATTCNEIANYMGITNQTTTDTQLASTPEVPTTTNPTPATQVQATQGTQTNAQPRARQQQQRLPGNIPTPTQSPRHTSSPAGGAAATRN